MSLDQRFAGFKAASPPDLWDEVERRAGSPSGADLPVHLGAARRWSRAIGGTVAAALVAALFLWPFLGLTHMEGNIGPIPPTQPPAWVVEQAVRMAAANQDPNPTSADWVLAEAKVIAPAVGLTPDQVSGQEYLVVLHGHFTSGSVPIPAGASFPTGTVVAFTLDPSTHNLKDFGIGDQAVDVPGLQPFTFPVVLPPSPSVLIPVGATCTTSQLSLRRGALVSEATGQNTRLLMLTNTSSVACHLDGFPSALLLDASGNPIPFDYRDGGDQMLTSRPPTPVPLHPGETAYLAINKYRCDQGDKTLAISLEVTPPGSVAPLNVRLGRMSLGYCGPGDPGSVVSVSPIEPTVRAVFAH